MIQVNDFHDACVLRVLVDTNAPQDGDAGHGARTDVVLFNVGGFAISYGPTSEATIGARDQLAIRVYGDAEARVLAEGLTWAGIALQQQQWDNAHRSELPTSDLGFETELDRDLEQQANALALEASLWRTRLSEINERLARVEAARTHLQAA